MIPFDYALGLLTILMGLALTDIALSFHKLAIRGRDIRWDGRPLIAAAMVVFECVRLWFAQWTLRNSAIALTFPVYLGLFLQMLLLVLLAAASLPDDPDTGCDMRAVYDRRRRYFWGLFTGYYLCFFISWLVFGATNSDGSGPAGILDWTRVLAPMLFLPLLIVIRRRWLDYLIPACFIIFYAARYWHATLSAA